MALAFESPLSQTIPKMDGGLQRPQSALARGVHITELSDGCTNPDPIVLQETDILMEQYLSPTKLQTLTGCDNLEVVTELELKVDTSETSLNNFGALLPNLTVLKLSGSVIPNIRDLGSSLRNLEVLWMSRCSLEELDGVSSMLKMRELYLAYNEVADISPLGMLEDLQILDLEGNNIDDIGQVQYLTLCSKLQHLTLDGNPICITPTVHAQEVNYDYRQAVKKILIHLVTLDDKSWTDTDTTILQNVFDTDWAYLEELQKDAIVMESVDNEPDSASVAGRPSTSALRPATAYRPGSALRPSSGFRPMSSNRRPASISGGRPSSAWTEGSKRRPASSDATEGMESTSDLTRGVVICGNPSKALRARRSNSQESVDKSPSTVTAEQSPRTPSAAASSPKVKQPVVRRGAQKAAEEEEEEEGRRRRRVEEEEEGAKEHSVDDGDLRLLMEELHSWKMEHEKRLEKIRESKAPQVFTIDHDSGSSGGGGGLSDEPSDASDSEDRDFRPDSAMARYRHQLSEQSSSSHVPVNPVHPAAHSFRAEVDTNNDNDHAAVAVLSHPPDRAASRSQPQKAGPTSEQTLREYERSLGEDQHLLKEYQRLEKAAAGAERAAVAAGVSSSSSSSITSTPGELRELRVPSAGTQRGASPRRGASPKPAPFPLGPAHPGQALGPEAAFREHQQLMLRPRKIKIGPTGLPGSSHTQQPQIRDVLTPPGKPGLTAPTALRPPSSSSSSSSLQHRFRRTLPEVPPLPSRPPPVTKS